MLSTQTIFQKSSHHSKKPTIKDECSNQDRIDRLKKMGTPIISDVLNKLNITNCTISGVRPLKESMVLCGMAFTVLYADKNDPAPELFEKNRFFLDDIPKDSQNTLVMIENKGTPGLGATWGYLVSLYAKHKGILGTITNGSIRDVNDLNELSYPVFFTGKNCKNSNDSYKVIATQKPIQLNGVTINPSDYVLADDSGIVIIRGVNIEEVLSLAEQKQQDEKQISELINTGLSLREIDEIMQNQLVYQQNNSH